MNRHPIFVAEVKPKSPFDFQSPLSDNELFRIATAHGDMLSIHTHEAWGGSFTWLKSCRARTEKPILAKGIHATDDDIERALDCGADRVLVVGRIPADKYLDRIWYEPASLSALWDAPTSIKLVWNRRDLSTGGYKNMTSNGTTYDDKLLFETAHAAGIWICQASFIRRPRDVQDNVQAFIVGEHLPEFVKELW